MEIWRKPYVYNNQKRFKDSSRRVSKFKSSLYGLKQSPHCWKCFGQFLIYLGSKASEANPCLYILIVLHVDDGLIAATDQQDFEMFIKKLRIKFQISVSFLGL
ncbi:retrovirus-related Pol polyprotein from transposon TNT 1-94 [Trichonephila inaurata madagascariensis]|uniref:Retrovirus-related Pol polyprotein from transposon TNT 1-94 n=1 Tax=Trichonephila inaurata madagascariensis TaxID=2747483 RepID=A0A8X6WZN2_9ARAC|nr:retrovirus-related Pol polyprotein from transposon TNT 1-94 [Trichonephila inaurata madagascariensis]